MKDSAKPKAIPTKQFGLSTLGGTNVGDYPKHQFVYNANVEFERNWPLKVVVVGDDEWVAGCSRFRRSSRIFALELVVEGEMEFIQEGRKHRVKPGELLLLQPGMDYVMSTDCFLRKKVMILGGYMINSLLASGGWGGIDTVKLTSPERVAGCFDMLYDACVKKESGYMRQCSTTAYSLLLELSSEIAMPKISSELNRVLCYMEENIMRGVSLASLCESFGMSPSSLCRLFKRELGCSPIEYFIRKRIECAKELLLSSTLSVKRISTDLGYANQFFFSTEFKRRTGLPPKLYRATYR